MGLVVASLFLHFMLIIEMCAFMSAPSMLKVERETEPFGDFN